MLEIKVIATGSKGNCYRVTDGVTTVLLEAGIRFSKIKEGLNYKLREIDFCLVTHEHNDHAIAVKDVLKRGINTYMSEGTARALDIKSHRLNTIKKGVRYRIKSFEFIALDSYHDAEEPFCYIIKSLVTGESLFFATDTCKMPLTTLKFDYLLTEINHSIEIIRERLKDEKEPNRSLIKRVLKTHMSLESYLRWFEKVDKTKLKEVHIIHLSDTNSSIEQIEKALTPLITSNITLKVY